MHDTICLRKMVMRGMALQPCVYTHMCVCARAHTCKGKTGVGSAGWPPCCALQSRRAQVPGSLPSAAPSRKLACTSDEFHMKQHRVDLFYRALTPDHIHGTGEEPP